MIKQISQAIKGSALVLAVSAFAANVSVSANSALDQIKDQSIAKGDVSLDEGSLVGFILNISNIFLGIVVAVSVLMLIYGAFVWITGFGGGDAEENGKKYVKNAIVGLIIALLAFTIVTLLGSAFSSDGFLSGLFGN